MTSCPTPVGQQAVLFEILRLYQGSSTFCLYQIKSRSCLYQVKSRFCLYQVKSTILFIPGGGVPLLTPASVGRRALGRPIHARRAIETAFAWLPSCLYQVKSRFCLYQVKSTILFIPGGGVPLLTPASVGRRALGRPIHARRAIETAFAWLPSWRTSPGRWRLLGQAGIAYLQYCRRLGSAI